MHTNHFYINGAFAHPFGEPRKNNREDFIVGLILDDSGFERILTGNQMTVLETLLRAAYRAGCTDTTYGVTNHEPH